jgi:hypothetical protein
MIEFDFKNWNRGVLYRVYLVQRDKNLWNDYDYSNEWKRLEEVMEKDLHDDEVFLFHHPKYSKKEYQRKYHLCPANGNARMVVGRMRNPLDFAYVSFVLHSYFYKVPYIVIEDYKHISPNPDVIADMVARAINWVLKDLGVEIVLERWDELVLYPIDFWESYKGELRKSGGKNLIPMGYEGALKVHKEKEAKKKKCKKAACTKKIDDIKYYNQHPNIECVLEFLRHALMGMSLAKEIARPVRFLCNRRIFKDGNQYRLPYGAFIKSFPEFAVFIKEKKYNDWLNPNIKSYDNDERNKYLEELYEIYLNK